jgi:hypothetical protein
MDMLCIALKIMHKTDLETKSFPLYKLYKIYVATFYLVVYSGKQNNRTHVKLTTRASNPI